MTMQKMNPNLDRSFSVDNDDQIPVVETYRDVGIEDQQLPERVKFVKGEIDRIHRMSGADELFAYASDPLNPPEPRMLAGAQAEALCELAAGSGGRGRSAWSSCTSRRPVLDAGGGATRTALPPC
jgi:hypothetical protein